MSELNFFFYGPAHTLACGAFIGNTHIPFASNINTV